MRKTYNFWSKIKFMIPCSPYPWLISNAPFDKPCPWIPPVVIMIWVVIRIREVSNKQHSLSFSWVIFIVSKCFIWIKALTKIPCKQCYNSSWQTYWLIGRDAMQLPRRNMGRSLKRKWLLNRIVFKYCICSTQINNAASSNHPSNSYSIFPWW